MTREGRPPFIPPPEEAQPQQKKRGRPRIYTDEERVQKQREHNRRYRKAHPEIIAEEKRRYREAHPEKVAERDRRYYQANREKVLENKRRYYLEVIKPNQEIKYLIDYTQIFPNPTDNEDTYSS